jgi:hypothetical protein
VVKRRPLPPVSSELTGRACNDASNRGMRREPGSLALASRTDWRQNLQRTSVDWGPYRRLADNGVRGAISILASNGERPPSAPILLSSDAFDERDRFDAWREELMLRVMRVDVDVPDKRSFHTRLRMLHLPNVSIIERRSTPSVVTRTAELVRDGDDSLVVSLPWRKSIETRIRLRVASRARRGDHPLAQ